MTKGHWNLIKKLSWKCLIVKFIMSNKKKKKLCDLLLTEYYDVVSKQQREEGNERYNGL